MSLSFVNTTVRDTKLLHVDRQTCYIVEIYECDDLQAFHMAVL